MSDQQSNDKRVARRTQGERSRETRDKLLRATIEILLESGYAGLTTAQVDTRAGVSSGARVHHFPTKADLVIAATSCIYERISELGQQRAESASRSTEPLRGFIQDCQSIYFDWPFVSALEIVLAARTDATLFARIHPILKEFHGKMRRTWLDALVGAGYDRKQTETSLRLTLNLIRGMAANKIWENDTAEYKRLIDDWCARTILVKRPSAKRSRRSGSGKPFAG